MKKLITAALSLMLVVGLSGLVVAGSLDAPGAPSAGSGMYTLQNLYDYLTSGSALTLQTGFQEPTLAPGSTMKTTKEIGDALKALFEQSEITAANVEQGKRFFCSQPGSWGIQTGIAQLMPTPTPTSTTTPTMTPTITPMPWDSAACAAKGGYWAATQLAAPNDMGCWFSPPTTEGDTGVDSCDAICENIPSTPMVCDSGAWNDSTDCAVGRHFRPGWSCAQQNIPGAEPTWLSRYGTKNECHYWTNSTGSPICSETCPGEQGRICVCKPE